MRRIFSNNPKFEFFIINVKANEDLKETAKAAQLITDKLTARKRNSCCITVANSQELVKYAKAL